MVFRQSSLLMLRCGMGSAQGARIRRSFLISITAYTVLVAADSKPSQADTGRVPAEQPFAATSIWNTPLGRGASFQADDSPETRMLHSDNVGGHSGSYSWIGFDAISVNRAKRDDPVVRWTFDGRSASAPWPHGGPIRNGSVMLHAPSGIRFLGGTDGHAVLIDPSGDVAYETWKGRWDAERKEYHARYFVRVDLRGSGIAGGEARSEGIRAFGGSLLGGLIRCDELAAGEIPHAIAMIISTTQLRKAPTMAGQKVWPAMLSDGGGRNDYAGLVPMGALIAMRPDVDIASLGLSREGTALARAYQRFGGYVVDAATKTMTLAAIEGGCDQAMIKNLQIDRRIIRDRLARVLNNGPDHIGGPGSRVAAPPPPLRAK